MERAKCKGEKLHKAQLFLDADAAKLFTPNQASIQSPFNNFDDLKKWGWHNIPSKDVPDYAMEMKEESWSIDHVLRVLGVSDKSVQDDGAERSCASGALFMFSINPTDGGACSIPSFIHRPHHTILACPFHPVIMAMNRKSHKSATQDRTPKSDAAWLFYHDRVKKLKTPSTAKYFLSLTITNKDTQWLVTQALWLEKQDRGHTTYPDSHGFNAILGSPNAQGFTFFLITHKKEDQLGEQHISEITTFECESWERDICLLLKVLPVPPSDSKLAPAERGVMTWDMGMRVKLKRWPLVTSRVVYRGERNIERTHFLRPVHAMVAQRQEIFAFRAWASLKGLLFWLAHKDDLKMRERINAGTPYSVR
ncbi:hypothetical protein K458DRAFT_387101 [Lentithecium fluviatile CBS 122367]|uniref:Uncharacterized protein n=1 Tax=Lentithecium fluviatile CBS 122367 TaxID=1168545 RepID=A0A6G1J7J2_9PLEO|nr:hypothetical protein K458DRAFT_387101 [Lentithecium fluviatile CBS 122367]